MACSCHFLYSSDEVVRGNREGTMEMHTSLLKLSYGVRYCTIAMGDIMYELNF